MSDQLTNDEIIERFKRAEEAEVAAAAANSQEPWTTFFNTLTDVKQSELLKNAKKVEEGWSAFFKEAPAMVDRKKLLNGAVEAVEAGAELKLNEAKLVLSLTRSKHVRQWPDGNYHYPDKSECDPFILGGAVIPRAVHLAALRIDRNPTAAADRRTRGDVHNYELFTTIVEKTAEILRYRYPYKDDPLHRLRSEAIKKYNSQLAENEKLMSIENRRA